ncbi:hypothetical protein FSP39_000090 [Pinctada imbricata]|uniref:Mab-21-like HhH/H2TH-like domain-containing protein n=1 Tax=Pinctada imbricata TaxID=66713 RepID=A0AA88XH16_PINIB|nr:hypothetical protein FSP39_000090 [Pinctada imbricata]
MATSSWYDDGYLISKGIYRIVSDVVGPECIVKLQRQKVEIYDTLVTCSSNSCDKLFITSGSRAEGFEFESSDIDIMHVDKNAIVMSDPTILTVSYRNIPSLLIMETDNTAPGFAFVKCLKYDNTNIELKHSLELRGPAIYVSSKQIRETFMSSSISSCHGPCQTSTEYGIEGDVAYTLNCPTWPKQAIPFIRRSLDRGWPSYDVLTDICKDGCLLVPINSKQQQCSDMIDLEWRISFSLAEKKLVLSMNHCQFLCYGLFKVFLNEVIKTKLSDKDLLCSYFMKTAVFWEISDNSSEWTPFNFLHKFWNVFRRLIKWVCIGYCPNFFIPEYNMFYGKICGQTQTALLGILRELYSEGYYSLLRCSSLYQNLSRIIYQPQIAYLLSCNEEEYVPISMIERGRSIVICMVDIPCDDVTTVRTLKTLQNVLMLKPETMEMLYAVHIKVNLVLQQYAENLLLSTYSGWPTYPRNKKRYEDMIKAFRIISRTKTFFCMNYLILIQHMYMAGNYQRTIEMIHYVKHKLQSQPYMYLWNLDTDIIMTLLQQGMSHDTLIKSYVVSSLKITDLNIIEELRLECWAVRETIGAGLLVIPPLVFLNFLLILSYTRLGENHRRIDVLDELQTLVYCDDGINIRTVNKAVSWEILGICQQICGDRHGSLQSYIYALNDEHSLLKMATLERINSLHYH